MGKVPDTRVSDYKKQIKFLRGALIELQQVQRRSQKLNQTLISQKKRLFTDYLSAKRENEEKSKKILYLERLLASKNINPSKHELDPNMPTQEIDFSTGAIDVGDLEMGAVYQMDSELERDLNGPSSSERQVDVQKENSRHSTLPNANTRL